MLGVRASGGGAFWCLLDARLHVWCSLSMDEQCTYILFPLFTSSVLLARIHHLYNTLRLRSLIS